MEKLSIKGLASGGAVLWALYMLLAGWGASFGWGGSIVTAFSGIYIGYAPGFIGGIIGALWGLLDGAIAGAIIAAVYNCVVTHSGKRGRRKRR